MVVIKLNFEECRYIYPNLLYKVLNNLNVVFDHCQVKHVKTKKLLPSLSLRIRDKHLVNICVQITELSSF